MHRNKFEIVNRCTRCRHSTSTHVCISHNWITYNTFVADICSDLLHHPFFHSPRLLLLALRLLWLFFFLYHHTFANIYLHFPVYLLTYLYSPSHPMVFRPLFHLDFFSLSFVHSVGIAFLLHRRIEKVI